MDRGITFFLSLLLLSSLCLVSFPCGNSDWFLKSISSDGDYIRLDELTGIVSTTEVFTVNVSCNVYVKIVGTVGVSPWLIEDSDWYVDLYLRSTVSSDWELVKAHAQDVSPSSEKPVEDGIPAELKAVVYHPVEFMTAISGDILPDGDVIPCMNTKNFPESGSVKIDDEVIHYQSKGYDGYLHDIVRGYEGTTPGFHSIGSEVSLYSAIFKIPIVIALNLSSGSGGSGGGMHPSRSHVFKINIAEGKPPIPMAHITKWYNMVTGDASKSYDEDGTIVSYQWDLTSDGIWDYSGPHMKYNYTREGTYLLTLRVTDNDGMFSEYETSLTIIFPPLKKMTLFSIVYGLPIIGWIVIFILVIIVLYFLFFHEGSESRSRDFRVPKKRRAF